MTFLMMLFFQEAGRPKPDRRPARHARPKGWTGPANRAPFPIVADPDEGYGVWPFLVQDDVRDHELSPINREILRRRFAAMWQEVAA